MSIARLQTFRFALVLGFAGILDTVWMCGGSLVAVAVVAAAFVPLRRALIVTAAVWALAEAAGFGVLHYPHDGLTIAWGAGLLGAALIATGVAAGIHALVRVAPVTHRGDATVRALTGAVAFAAAFVAYEIALFGFSLAFASGSGFTLPVIREVLVTNALGGIALASALALALRAIGADRRVVSASTRT